MPASQRSLTEVEREWIHGGFSSRRDVYFDCQRLEAVKGYYSDKIILRHLDPDDPMDIGVYPVDHTNDTVRWGCIDVDVNDPNVVETCLWRAEAFGLELALEPSHSKGFHLWLFADAPVQAADMRRTLLQLAHSSIKEVNPKREDGRNYGNCVRLPYAYPQGVNALGYPRRVFVEPDDWYRVADPLEAIDRATFPGSMLADIASRWRPPSELRVEQVERFRSSAAKLEDLEIPSSRMSRQEAAQIVAGHRPINVGERDVQFFTIAHFLRGSGIGESDAHHVVCNVYDANAPLWADESFTLDEALTKVSRVYGGR